MFVFAVVFVVVAVVIAAAVVIIQHNWFCLRVRVLVSAMIIYCFRF